MARGAAGLCGVLFFVFLSLDGSMAHLHAATLKVEGTRDGLLAGGGDTMYSQYVSFVVGVAVALTDDAMKQAIILILLVVFLPVFVAALLSALLIKFVFARIGLSVQWIRQLFRLAFMLGLSMAAALYSVFMTIKDKSKPHLAARPPIPLPLNFTTQTTPTANSVFGSNWTTSNNSNNSYYANNTGTGSDNSVLFVTVATQSERMFDVLIESLQRHNASYQVLGFGEKWQGLTWRHHLFVSYLKTIDPTTVVCLIDAFDTLLLSSPKELRAKFEASGAGIVISQDTVGTLPSTQLTGYTRYKVYHCDYNYCMNSGMIMGRAATLVAFYEELFPACDVSDRGDDQRCIIRNEALHAVYNLRLDHFSDMFLNVYQDNLLHWLDYADVVDTVDGLRYELRSVEDFSENGNTTTSASLASARPCLLSIPGAFPPKGVIGPLGYNAMTSMTPRDYLAITAHKLQYYVGFFQSEMMSVVLMLFSIVFLVVL
eukprot:c1720_g1_i1.p1 GENE.c1720_g1_i1~~c1720_g1_i1.p1  ORF type:complete len:485 (-),score=157.58 c1720_g1_i1:1363-2817(-)